MPEKQQPNDRLPEEVASDLIRSIAEVEREESESDDGGDDGGE